MILRTMLAAVVLLCAGVASALGQTTETARPIPPAPTAALDPARVSGIADGLFIQAMADHAVPGAAAAIVTRDAVLHLRGYGTARIEPESASAKPDTLFQIASISKTFTYIAIMQLVEEGKISLDDPINDHLKPELEIPDTAGYPPILIRHLLTHTAGFEDTALGHLFVDAPDELLPPHEYVLRYRPARVRPPGVLPAYSNYGVTLLGLAVEHVSGQSFFDYTESRIFRPLGMASTSFRGPYDAKLVERGLPAPLPEALQARTAQMLKGERGDWTAGTPEYVINVAPAASVWTSAADMARFAQALLDPAKLEAAGVLKQTTFAQMMTPLFDIPGDPGASLRHGFLSYRFPGAMVGFGHDGAMAQGASSLVILPQQGVAMFLTSNGPGGFAFIYDAPLRILKALFDPADPEPVRSDAITAKARSVEGEWINSRRAHRFTEGALMGLDTRTVKVEDDGDVLIGSLFGETSRYVPIGDNLWWSPKREFAFAIAPGADGEPRLWSTFGESALERVPPLRSATWRVVALLAAAGLGVFAAISLARRLVFRPPSLPAQRLAGGLTDAAAIAWTVAIGAFIAIIAPALAEDFVDLLFEYPGGLDVATTLMACAAALSALAAAALIFALTKGLKHGWSWWRWTKQIAAVVVTLTASLAAGVSGLLGYSGF